MADLIRRPTAFVPLCMSSAALALLVGYALVVGVADPTRSDEGLAARLFQLLLVAQLPIIAVFGARWLPTDPRPATIVIGLQVIAAIVPLILVSVLEGTAAGT